MANDKLPRGTQIASIPTHAHGDINHPDVQFGFISSGPNSHGDYFCRYWSKYSPGELRTKANSECTTFADMVVHQSHMQSEVEAAIRAWCDPLPEENTNE